MAIISSGNVLEFHLLLCHFFFFYTFLMYFILLYALLLVFVVPFSDVFCGYLLCSNIGRAPRIGTMKGEITPASFNHQGKLVDCR